MTNKEAINIIKYCLIDEICFVPRELGVEALNLAIKALEYTEQMKGEEE